MEPNILKSKVLVFLELHRQKNSLKKTTLDLKQTVEELNKANHMILEQQRSVIEEERLKVLLQMAGATAHEINQPLVGLLGNIEMMDLHKDNPEKLAVNMARIKEAGQRIADIVKKIQTIRRHDTIPYPGGISIINLDQRIKILAVEDSDDDFEAINSIVKANNQINLSRARSIHDAMEALERLSLIHISEPTRPY